MNDNTTKQTKIEAYGVKGLKSKPWRKVFKNMDALNAWLDKQGGDAELQGWREAE